MKNEITMGSSIIDFYMDGYDEGKCDDIIEAPIRTSKKKKNRKSTMHAKNKKAYYKAKNRMKQLSAVAHYIPSPEDKQVVQGMLRNHQLPMDHCDMTFGTSIGNKRRAETAAQKMHEAFVEDALENA